MADTTDIEKKNLEAHVELCAERYRHLETKLETVDTKLGGLERVIREVHDMVAHMKERRNNQLISWGVGIITALVAALAWFVTQYFLAI